MKLYLLYPFVYIVRTSLEEETIVFSSNDSYLQLLGLLSPVDHLAATLQASHILITWTPPFSLDIQRENSNNITYCVIVMDAFSLVMQSECGFTDTVFDYTISSGGECENYIFTVIPVNFVGNGTQASVEYSRVLRCKSIDDSQSVYLIF